jgi:hypothetical protein
MACSRVSFTFRGQHRTICTLLLLLNQEPDTTHVHHLLRTSLSLFFVPRRKMAIWLYTPPTDRPFTWRQLPGSPVPPCTTLDIRTGTDSSPCSMCCLCSQVRSASQTQPDLWTCATCRHHFLECSVFDGSFAASSKTSRCGYFSQGHDKRYTLYYSVQLVSARVTSAHIWNFTQRRLVVGYRRLGTNYRFHLQGLLKVELKSCVETQW